MKGYSIPVVQNKCKKINEVSEAIETKTPSLATINKKFGEDFTQAYIEGWIVNLREFLNVGKKMNDLQTQETAVLIMQQYHAVTIADINLIFKRAKLGQWGQIYDRLDGQVILSWFEQYFRQRCNACADKSILEADKYKNDVHQRYSVKYNKKFHAQKLGAFIEKFKKA